MKNCSEFVLDLWIFSDVYGSLGSQGEHCLDLPTYSTSTGSLVRCLARLYRLVLKENASRLRTSDLNLGFVCFGRRCVDGISSDFP